MSEWVSLGRGLARWGRCQLDVSRSQVNDAGLKASVAHPNPNPNPNPNCR